MKITKKELAGWQVLAEGGEGFIHEHPQGVLKIYKNTAALDEKEEKLKLLMQKAVPPNVIKPLELVYQAGRFCGFLMQKVEGEELRRLSNKNYVVTNSITKQDILKMAVQIRETVACLHKEDIFIGDLNDRNILFDAAYNVYFIDADSWSIGKYRCGVIMDLFKDPLLKGNAFDRNTDSYAFSILLFKSLTRLHPYGGTVKPEMDIMERMQRGITVIDNPDVVIPGNVDKWAFFSKQLLAEMKEIFTHKKRLLPEASVTDFYANLALCSLHNDYYYNRFTSCPVCDDKAAFVEKVVPEKAGDIRSDIPLKLLFSDPEVKIILGLNLFQDKHNTIVSRYKKRKVAYDRNTLYRFSEDETVLYKTGKAAIEVEYGTGKVTLPKLHNSGVVVRDRQVYFIDPAGNLVQFTVDEKYNYTQTLAPAGYNSCFEAVDANNYLLCSHFGNFMIINNSGYNYTLNEAFKPESYGIHYDRSKKNWLFAAEDEKGHFRFYIFNKNTLLFANGQMRLQCTPDHLCFDNDTIFIPSDGKITGYNFVKNAYKEFHIEIINGDSRLLRSGSKIIVLNEKAIYELG